MRFFPLIVLMLLAGCGASTSSYDCAMTVSGSRSSTFSQAARDVAACNAEQARQEAQAREIEQARIMAANATAKEMARPTITPTPEPTSTPIPSPVPTIAPTATAPATSTPEPVRTAEVIAVVPVVVTVTPETTIEKQDKGESGPPYLALALAVVGLVVTIILIGPTFLNRTNTRRIK